MSREDGRGRVALLDGGPLGLGDSSVLEAALDASMAGHLVSEWLLAEVG